MCDVFSHYVGTHWEVAVWWPKDAGYGGRKIFRSREEADKEVAHLKAAGYGSTKFGPDGKPSLNNKSEIHTWCVASWRVLLSDP
jgi:hypothetical protein